MDSSKELSRALDILLDISSILMSSGANTNRARLSITRFASVLNFEASCIISQKAIILTLTDKNTNFNRTKIKSIPPHALNFSTISTISLVSWKATAENWTIDQIEDEVERIKKQESYNKFLVLIAVSFAGAGFCNIFGGDYLNMLVAFVSTFIGRYIFVFISKRKYNVYIRVFIASFIASIISALGVVFSLGENPQTALATSILFLVPGVALINSFTDMMDNNVLNGMVRFAHGLMTVMVMTLGLFLAMLIFHLKIV